MPNTRVTRISIRLTTEEREELEKYCQMHDMTVSTAIRAAIKEYIQSNN